MHLLIFTSRDRIVVSTLRCGRNNPGSNPGHGKIFNFPPTCFFFITQFFSTQPQCCLTFFFFELSFKCCLLHKIIIILRDILYLVQTQVYLCRIYLCDLLLIFSLIFIVINHITSLSYYFWMITWVKKANNSQIAKVQPQSVLHSFCLIFCQFQPGVAYKSVVYKNNVYWKTSKDPDSSSAEA